MVLHGRIENGVVVFPEGTTLPDGTEVSVVVRQSDRDATDVMHHVRLPLVASKRPGSVQLTSERIAKILSNEDASA